ncbi:putative pyrroloquinoline-quinone binding quinoprotein [Desulfobotulus alkaliphilus]|uniref:Putative pyrroloquinoline-quinone binding quinoprotein n=1 Tax=Desulfobotulus alkaliphilus TaxID=622671 RepID=A0A562S6D2_9BACT|nr:PQQ-binding-like beta-propeller repeat protein [Desulfobotulus alkaliphilus]TWI76882.1 putative pyrroloquinoline-quinone binding quinoprotein [Desulfobotulus alkaliphilus]
MKRLLIFLFLALFVVAGCNSSSSSGSPDPGGGDTGGGEQLGVIVTRSPVGGGTVSGPYDQISSGVYRINTGEKAVFTITANTGYRIENASGCGGTLEGQVFTTAPVTETCYLTVNFTELPNPISCSTALPVSPLFGQQSVSLTPVFEWSACEHADGNAVEYDIYLCAAPDTNDSIDGHCRISNPLTNYKKVATGLTETKWIPSEALDEETKYFWFLQVRSGNDILTRAVGAYDDAHWYFTTSKMGGRVWSYAWPTINRPMPQTALSSDGGLFIGDLWDGLVVAVNISDGEEQWRFDLTELSNRDITTSIVDIDYLGVLPDGSVLAQHRSSTDQNTRGWLGALSAIDGDVIWENASLYRHRSEPAIMPDGKVAMIAKRTRHSDDPLLMVFENGIEQWVYDGKNPGDSQKTDFFTGNDLSYIAASPSGGIYGFTFPGHPLPDSREKMSMKLIQDGLMEWDNRFSGTNYDDPQYISRWRSTDGFQAPIAYDLNNDLYIIGGAVVTGWGDKNAERGRHRLHKVSHINGEVLWTWTGNIPYARINSRGVVIRKDSLYLVMGTTLFAVDTATGQTLWQMPLPAGDSIDQTEARRASIAVLENNRLLVVLGDVQDATNAWVIDEASKSILLSYFPDIEPEQILATQQGMLGDCLNMNYEGLAIFCISRSSTSHSIDAVDLSAYGGLDAQAAWPITGQNPQRTHSRR